MLAAKDQRSPQPTQFASFQLIGSYLALPRGRGVRGGTQAAEAILDGIIQVVQLATLALWPPIVLRLVIVEVIEDDADFREVEKKGTIRANSGFIRGCRAKYWGSTVMAIRLAALISAAFGFASVSLPASAQSLGDLYTKAKSEGALLLYVGGPTAPWEAMAKIFNEKYPGITVSIGGGFSNMLDKKIDAQIAAGKLEVDAAILQTIADFVHWKDEGHLIDFKPAGFDEIDPRFKDPDGAYWATMVNAVPYMYDTEKVAAADVPDSALDFLKPQFKGKIVTAYPADDDVTLWVFYHIVQKYGWSYMDKYMAAKPNFIQGHLGEQRSIGSGQNLVTFDSIFNITTVLKKRQGMKIDTHFPTVDATPFWPLSGAIFKGAPHPNAAKLFLSWLLEPTQQIATETWSGRRDVPPPTGYEPIFSYKVVTDYKAFLVDQTQIADLRKRFEKYSGPIVNAGGVR